MSRNRNARVHTRSPSNPARFKGRTLLCAILFLLILVSSLPAQVEEGSRYISFGYGRVEDDFSLAVRLSGQFREDMGFEVLMGFVPSKGEFSDIYSLFHYRYHLWPGKRIVPHLVGGAGAIIVVGGGGRESDFVISTGGGAAAYITENVAFRFDVENFTLFFEDATENRQSYGAGIVLIF